MSVATTPPVLSASGIYKSFGGVHALQDVRFEVVAGEVHALLGENGAGKSTLIKIFTGVHRPDAGAIHLDGVAVSFSGPRDARDAGIAAIYQEPSLFPDLDIAENIFIGRQPTRAGSVAWRQMAKDAQVLLDTLGLKLDPRTKAKHLSVAQQQGVEIARALSINAKILIMDEPTSSLTLAEVDDLFRIVRRLREQGTAIIFISHRLEELFQIADRVTILRDGHYVDTRGMEGITTDGLVQMMVGRTLADLFPKLDVAPGATMLQVERLSREGRFQEISFELHAGEILGMAGLVGAGRTEVAETIMGIRKFTAGEIQLNGAAVAIRTPEDAVAAGINYLAEDRQGSGILTGFTVADNITLVSLRAYCDYVIDLINGKRQRSAAQEHVERFNIKTQSLDTRLEFLSGGNQQKVSLAKSIDPHPIVLIADEPTRGVDVSAKQEIYRFIKSLADMGLSCLFISSEQEEIVGMCHRVVVMKEGKIMGTLTGDEISEAEIMFLATGVHETEIETETEIANA